MPALPLTCLSEHILERICGEYLEMPGLRLTRQQAQRLWGLDEATCAQSLEFLVGSRFLIRIDGNTYARLTEGAVRLPPLQMVTAALERVGPGRLSNTRAS
jgi:hypothetical protein